MAYTYYKDLIYRLSDGNATTGEIDSLLDEINLDESLTADEYQSLYIMLAGISRT